MDGGPLPRRRGASVGGASSRPWVVPVTNKQLAEAARQAAEQHPARTPERRAAAALWVALGDTKTPSAARTALGTFADPQTTADATALLRELQTKAAST
jgi:hypothetical protein